MNGNVARWLVGASMSVILSSCSTETVQPSSRSTLLDSTNSYGEYCIPYSEFSLNMVATDVPLSAVIDLLGEPQQRAPIAPDSDIPVSSYVYPGLVVYHFDNQVAELYATDAKWETPSGLRVGLTNEALIKILGRVPEVTERYEAPLSYEIPVCDQDLSPDVWTAVLFVILFDGDGIVTALSIEREWP